MTDPVPESSCMAPGPGIFTALGCLVSKVVFFFLSDFSEVCFQDTVFLNVEQVVVVVGMCVHFEEKFTNVIMNICPYIFKAINVLPFKLSSALQHPSAAVRKWTQHYY